MNILWITLESVLPADSGGRIGVYKRLQQIAKTENIYLFYLYDDEMEMSYTDELKKYCKEVHPYNRNQNKKRALLQLCRFPFTVGSRYIPNMKKDIKFCIEKNKIDIINVDFPQMCVNLLGISFNIPIVLNEHNVEWMVYKKISDSQKSLILKTAYWIDSFRLKRYERKVFRRININNITFVSEKDMELMISNGFVEREKCVLIPVGAEIRRSNHAENISNRHNILFVGKMSYGPNIEAVTWFVNCIFPKIREEIPDSVFYIVGKEPTDAVYRLESSSVYVTGMVDDVSKYYDLADLVVLPLKNGGGVKVKLLEAISYRKPIVSTSVGVEGTYFDNHLIPVTNDSCEFAKYCKDILICEEFYPEKEVYGYFILNYTWEHIGKKYLNMFREAMNEKSKRL